MPCAPIDRNFRTVVGNVTRRFAIAFGHRTYRGRDGSPPPYVNARRRLEPGRDDTIDVGFDSQLGGGTEAIDHCCDVVGLHPLGHLPRVDLGHS